MSQSTITPTFTIKDIDVSKLGGIQIIDVSEDLYFGRRFHVMYVDVLTNDHTVSKAVKFSKIVKVIKNISTKEDNLENLKEIKSFLGDLKLIETEAICKYSERGCLYRLLTRISRAFSSGSHLDRIKSMEADIQGRINKIDPDNLSFNARMIPIRQMDYAKSQSALLLLVDDCLRAKQLDDALKACGCIFDYHNADPAFSKIAQAFIERGNLPKAFSVVNRISKKEDQIEIVRELVMACMTQDDPEKSLALQAISLIPYNEGNLAIIEDLRGLVDNA